MDDTHVAQDHGFTLIEIAITVAIVATTLAAGVGISLASRSFAVSAAAAEFDHLLDSARTVARETQGATLVFAPDAYGDGTEVRVLVPGPNATLVASSLPIVRSRAAIEESQSLGKAPFAFVVHTGGALGGRPGFRLGDSTASGEVGCPARGAFHFVIRTAGTTADRFVPCRITLATTGPIALASWPPATVAPAPTPCSGIACAPAVLPTPPSSNPSCPPNFTAIFGGCTPATPPPAGGPRYHVTASLASPTMTVGGSDDSLVAEATLTNASTVPAGTPTSIPVLLQQLTDTICTASPPGPQRSGATFAIKAFTQGTCLVTIAADPSAIPGATADTMSISVTVSGPSPSPIPSPLTCDLRANGKCYHTIVPRTSHIFEKNVVPDTKCGDTGNGLTCWYIDSIKEITLYHDYWFLPPVPPNTPSTEILFRIEGIDGLTYGCAPYSYFAMTSVFTGIVWPSAAIGAPVNVPVGFGQPSIYTAVNTVQPGLPSDGLMDDTVTSSRVGATLSDMLAAVAYQRIGADYMFTYWGPLVNSDTYITWFPDFPGCDAPGQMNSDGSVEYGDVTVPIIFEIYQAVP